ncbi:hypothetical protein IscW_ISCW019849 [Ixodes scapularis]|uniref:Uncharacterized protein n=1 Tax=Ixodes scapularis TaxID=6945 RepID=B7PSK9_IXOSC|nr:hypothetical protein IscW_ISCW019849 [Ixodes scapularis]|eukprot:XP_002402707.1 hypothetical protein IscW_ISCW019849 [Ixodes scapularis]
MKPRACFIEGIVVQRPFSVVYLTVALVACVLAESALAQSPSLYRTTPLLEAFRDWMRRPTFTFARPSFLPSLGTGGIRLRPGLQQVLRPIMQRPAIANVMRPALNLRPVIATGIANLGSLIRRPFFSSTDG